MEEDGRAKVVPLFGAPVGEAERAAKLEAAAAAWRVFREGEGRRCPDIRPSLAEQAMALIIEVFGTKASWDHFEVRAFDRRIARTYPELDEQVRFMFVGSIAMFLAFLAHRGQVAPDTVSRAFDTCEALDPDARPKKKKRVRRS